MQEMSILQEQKSTLGSLALKNDQSSYALSLTSQSLAHCGLAAHRHDIHSCRASCVRQYDTGFDA